MGRLQGARVPPQSPCQLSTLPVDSVLRHSLPHPCPEPQTSKILRNHRRNYWKSSTILATSVLYMQGAVHMFQQPPQKKIIPDLSSLGISGSDGHNDHMMSSARGVTRLGAANTAVRVARSLPSCLAGRQARAAAQLAAAHAQVAAGHQNWPWSH